MVQSKAKTVEEYLKSLSVEQRKAVDFVRSLILKNIPKGFVEVMQYGMISYVVPLTVFPKTYNHQPLAIISLAAQKNYCALYLMNIYTASQESTFRKEFESEGKKLDMGKCCVRFRKADDLAVKAIAKVISKTSVEEFIQQYLNARKKIEKN